MSAYVIVDVEVEDPEAYTEYRQQVTGTFAPFGGRFLVRGGKLEHLEGDPAVRRVVVVTHMPLVEGQMARDPGNRDWAFSNAYFGNLTLGNEVLKRVKVTHIISGHTHVERHGLAPRDAGPPIDARVLASDYGEPAWLGLELE